MVKIEITGYYTHFSFILFCIGFLLPKRSSYRYFILINSIVVGIVGNFIVIKDFYKYIQWYEQNDPEMNQKQVINAINIGNLLFHIVPMILSLVLLIHTGGIDTYYDMTVIFFYMFITFFIWSLLPYKKNIFISKIRNSYYSCLFATQMCAVIFFLTIFLLKK